MMLNEQTRGRSGELGCEEAGGCQLGYTDCCCFGCIVPLFRFVKAMSYAACVGKRKSNGKCARTWVPLATMHMRAEGESGGEVDLAHA
jgi:hypothetical protein